MGMANNQILDSQITASSVFSGFSGWEQWSARLGHNSAWTPARGIASDPYSQVQWIQVALNMLHKVVGVITQGYIDAWTTDFKVSFSEDDTLRYINETDGQPKVINILHIYFIVLEFEIKETQIVLSN